MPAQTQLSEPDIRVVEGSPDGADAPPNRRTPRLPSGLWPPPRWAVRIAVLLAFWAIAMLATIWLFSSEKVPEGTVVAGINIGGLDREAAIDALNAGLAAKSQQPISVTIDDEDSTIKPSDFGLSFDVARTVDSVRTHRLNPFEFSAALFGGSSTEPVVTVDQTKMVGSVKELAGQFNRQMREPAITFEGTEPTVADGVIGRKMERDPVVTAITSAYANGATTATIPIVITKPSVSDDAMNSALRDQAAKALSEGVSVTAGGTTVVANPDQIGPSLTIAGKDGKIVYQVDGERLHEGIAPGLRKVETPMKNAAFDGKGNKLEITPEQNGNGVDPVALGPAVADVLGKTGPMRHVDMPLVPTPAKIKVADVQAMGINEKLGTFTQKFPYAAYRVKNIGRASRLIDGTLLKPGETFSLNDTVGERTAANGFTKGFVVGEGGMLEEDYGGGVSTAATALWTAGFFAGMERVEQGAHLIWISRYRPGLEATVAWGLLDLKLRNNSPNGVLISMKTGKDFVTATFWGTKQYDSIKAISGPRENVKAFTSVKQSGKGCVEQPGAPGFDIAVTRRFLKAGQAPRDEVIRTHYIPEPKVQCVAAKDLPPPGTNTAAPTPGAAR